MNSTNIGGTLKKIYDPPGERMEKIVRDKGDDPLLKQRRKKKDELTGDADIGERLAKSDAPES